MSNGGGSVYERTIGELILSARGGTITDEDKVPQAQAVSELKRNGIRYEFRKRDKMEGVWIANGHSSLERLLAGTPWASQWARSLIRLKGAEKSDKGMKFGVTLQRAIWLPITTVLPQED
jgi:hypothetical protein